MPKVHHVELVFEMLIVTAIGLHVGIFVAPMALN
jgi:hypothetical protein